MIADPTPLHDDPTGTREPHPNARRRRHRAAGYATSRVLMLLLPELLVATALYGAVGQQIRARQGHHDRQRGVGVIEWVILIAISAAIAVTVGTLVFNKLQAKAQGIDLTTPGVR